MSQLLKLSRSQWIAIAVLASAVSIAGAVSLTTFTSGTTISASAVNANFTSLNNALPLVWASTDQTNGGAVTTASSIPTTLNTITVTAPSAGHLTISGSVYVNNDSSIAHLFFLDPQINGASIHSAGFMGAQHLAADTVTAAADSGSISYTATVPITQGTHTVSQRLYAGASNSPVTATYFYNRYNLTVVFVPSISGFTSATINAASQAPMRTE